MNDNQTLIVRYTEYYCYFFSVAIHELTGWPIYGVIPRGEDDPLHYINRTPDGRYFDIRGFSDKPLDADGKRGRPVLCDAAQVLADFSFEPEEALTQARQDAALVLKSGENLSAPASSMIENYAEAKPSDVTTPPFLCAS